MRKAEPCGVVREARACDLYHEKRVVSAQLGQRLLFFVEDEIRWNVVSGANITPLGASLAKKTFRCAFNTS